jgi:TPR repeat protein
MGFRQLRIALVLVALAAASCASPAREEVGPRAAFEEAVRIHSRDAGPEEMRRAAELYRIAVDAGNVGAAVNLGALYVEGRGVERDPEKAAELLLSAAQRGDPNGAFLLANLYRFEPSLGRSQVDVAYWMLRAAEGGNADAQLMMGVFYLTGDGVEEDTRSGIEWLQRAADQGHPDAKTGLGLAHMLGKGVEVDRAEARRLLEEAAAGHGRTEATARESLSRLAGQGAGGDERDPEKALARLRASAESGDVDAQIEMSRRYWKGDGVAADPEAAIAWMRRAAEAGNVVARGRLAILLEVGSEEAAAHAEAIRWYLDSADAGGVEAQLMLADHYRRGTTVDRDDAEAVKWFTAAVSDVPRPMRVGALGPWYWRAVTALRGWRRTLPVSVVAEGEARAAAWQADYEKRMQPCATCTGSYEAGEVEARLLEAGRYQELPPEPADPWQRSRYRLLETGSEARCSLGEAFGVTVEVRVPRPAVEVHLDVEWSHPAIDAPAVGVRGRKTRGWQFVRVVDGHSEPVKTLWVLGDPGELVAGTYRLTLRSRGIELLSRDFELADCTPSPL